jgi:hypothetical protein
MYTRASILLILILWMSSPITSSAQNVGIGTAQPAALLHVFNGSAGNPPPFQPLVVEGNDNTYINLLVPDGNESGLLFGKTNNAAHGALIYNNVSTLNGLQFRTNGNIARMALSSNGYLGIGNLAPANRLDVAGLNNWNLTGTEGDMRVGNNNYRLKIGVALDGGGAGGVGIMQHGQPGGYNVLTLGSQGNNILRLNGNLNRAGIGTDQPAADLEIRTASGFANPQLQVTQTNANDFSRIRLKNTNTTYWDIAAFHGASAADDRLNFFNQRTGSQFGINGNAALLFNNSAGGAGQVLQSNGAGATPSWVASTNTLYNGTVMANATATVTSNNTTPETTIPGLSSTFSTAGTAKVLINFNIEVQTLSCSFCGHTTAFLDIVVNGNRAARFSNDVANGTSMSFSASHLIIVGAGTHTIEIKTRSIGPEMRFATCCVFPNSLIYQVIPQ